MIDVPECFPGEDREWLCDLWRREWGAENMVSQGRLHSAKAVKAFLAWRGNERVGALSWDWHSDSAEVLSVNAVIPKSGIGSALLGALENLVEMRGGLRIFLVTSNDNLDALRFYQRRGYRLTAVFPGAVDVARSSIKPEIPEVGDYGIAIHDEIQLEKILGG